MEGVSLLVAVAILGMSLFISAWDLNPKIPDGLGRVNLPKLDPVTMRILPAGISVLLICPTLFRVYVTTTMRKKTPLPHPKIWYIHVWRKIIWVVLVVSLPLFAATVVIFVLYRRSLHSLLVSSELINTSLMDALENLVNMKGCGQLQEELNHLKNWRGVDKSLEQIVTEHKRLLNLVGAVNKKGCN